MRKLMMIMSCIWYFQGCTIQNTSKLNIWEFREIQIAKDAYILAGQNLIQIVNKSIYEEADAVFYVENELELAKVLQYSIESGEGQVSYQSEHVMDIDRVASILGCINPFDLSLIQNTVEYTNRDGGILYISNQITIHNLDTRYEESVQNAKQIILKILDPYMSVDEKIEAIHDYIVLNTIYETDAGVTQSKVSNVFQSAGVFTDGRAVCTGYSRAFMMLAKEAGIPAIFVTSKGMNHSWNYVYNGQKWRFIDVTWDDPVPDQKGVVDKRFLNLDEDEFMHDGIHIVDENERVLVRDVVKVFFRI